MKYKEHDIVKMKNRDSFCRIIMVDAKNKFYFAEDVEGNFYQLDDEALV